MVMVSQILGPAPRAGRVGGVGVCVVVDRGGVQKVARKNPNPKPGRNERLRRQDGLVWRNKDAGRGGDHVPCAKAPV